jgi:hypothetical protein
MRSVAFFVSNGNAALYAKRRIFLYRISAIATKFVFNVAH